MYYRLDKSFATAKLRAWDEVPSYLKQCRLSKGKAAAVKTVPPACGGAAHATNDQQSSFGDSTGRNRPGSPATLPQQEAGDQQIAGAIYLRRAAPSE